MKLDGDGTVAHRINGIDSSPVRTAPANGPGRTAAGAGNGASSGNPTGNAGVEVQITGAARDLAAIEQRLRDLPAIDEQRVAAVRQRLEDGSYRVDAQRIAGRLLGLEQELSRLDTPPST